MGTGIGTYNDTGTCMVIGIDIDTSTGTGRYQRQLNE
jgi:hypothetical protein